MPMPNMIKVCAQCGQAGQNADKIPCYTSEVNYVRMVLHSALLLLLMMMMMTGLHQVAAWRGSIVMNARF